MVDISPKSADFFGHSLRATYEIMIDMEQARAAFEILVNDMTDTCLLLTGSGRCLWGNQAAAEMLGVSRELIANYSLHNTLPEPQSQALMARLAQAEVTREPLAPFALAFGEGPSVKEYSWDIRPFTALALNNGRAYVAVARDVTTLLADRATQTRMANELETAKIIQDSFFPPAALEVGPLEIHSFYRPAERCSGDWWGRFELLPGVELICIADVTGHGAPAALLTAVAQGYFTTLQNMASYFDPKLIASPSFILHELDLVLSTAMARMKTRDLPEPVSQVLGQPLAAWHHLIAVTVFAAVLDLKKGVLRYANAGHNFPILIPESTSDDRCNSKSASPRLKRTLTLTGGGDALGNGSSSVHKETEIALRAGDRLILYTDGLIGNRGSEGSPWGLRRFHDSLLQGIDASPSQAIAGVISDAEAFFHGVAPADDMTVVAVSVAKDWSPATPI